ncbi:hypothetical protein HZS_6297 [Henneguya salminicola]|nr:hypothetical protein HZS_6297 [Henneguya salminicola]
MYSILLSIIDSSLELVSSRFLFVLEKVYSNCNKFLTLKTNLTSSHIELLYHQPVLSFIQLQSRLFPAKLSPQKFSASNFPPILLNLRNQTNFSCQFNRKYKVTVYYKCKFHLCPVKLIKKEINFTMKGEHTCNQTLNIQYLNSESTLAPSTTLLGYIRFREIGYLVSLPSSNI